MIDWFQSKTCSQANEREYKLRFDQWLTFIFHSCRNYISKYQKIALPTAFNLILPLHTYLHEFWRRSRVPLRRITCSNFPVPFVDLQIQPISDLDHWFQHQPLAHSLGAFWLTHKANENSKSTQWGKKVSYLLNWRLQCKQTEKKNPWSKP